MHDEDEIEGLRGDAEILEAELARADAAIRRLAALDRCVDEIERRSQAMVDAQQHSSLRR